MLQISRSSKNLGLANKIQNGCSQVLTHVNITTVYEKTHPVRTPDVGVQCTTWK